MVAFETVLAAVLILSALLCPFAVALYVLARRRLAFARTTIETIAAVCSGAENHHAADRVASAGALAALYLVKPKFSVRGFLLTQFFGAPELRRHVRPWGFALAACLRLSAIVLLGMGALLFVFSAVQLLFGVRIEGNTASEGAIFAQVGTGVFIISAALGVWSGTDVMLARFRPAPESEDDEDRK